VQKDADGMNYMILAAGSKEKMKAQKRMVKTDISYGDQVIISDGLRIGDQLITSGYQEVVDGQAITLK
jgi:multidrug efflux pump subunit AcrA (membrane-fusion protein)